MGRAKHFDVVALVKFRPHRPGESLVDEQELGIYAGLVAARVLRVPGAVQIHRRQTVDVELSPVVGEPLVAEAGGYAGMPCARSSPANRCALA